MCSKIAGLARQTRPDAIFPGGRRTRAGVSLQPFSGNEAEVRRDVPNRRFCCTSTSETMRRRTRIDFHDNVSLVNRAENGSQIARPGKTPDEIPRGAEQDKRTGSAPHPSPVVLWDDRCVSRWRSVSSGEKPRPAGRPVVVQALGALAQARRRRRRGFAVKTAQGLRG